MSITGEAADIAGDELSARPTAPHPRLSPEAVVEAQLAALRCGSVTECRSTCTLRLLVHGCISCACRFHTRASRSYSAVSGMCQYVVETRSDCCPAQGG